MKIILSLIGAASLLVLTGCQTSRPTAVANAGGTSPDTLGGQSQGHGQSSDIVDYRQILSDPGPF